MARFQVGQEILYPYRYWIQGYSHVSWRRAIIEIVREKTVIVRNCRGGFESEVDKELLLVRNTNKPRRNGAREDWVKP